MNAVFWSFCWNLKGHFNQWRGWTWKWNGASLFQDTTWNFTSTLPSTRTFGEVWILIVRVSGSNYRSCRLNLQLEYYNRGFRKTTSGKTTQSTVLQLFSWSYNCFPLHSDCIVAILVLQNSFTFKWRLEFRAWLILDLQSDIEIVTGASVWMWGWT